MQVLTSVLSAELLAATAFACSSNTNALLKKNRRQRYSADTGCLAGIANKRDCTETLSRFATSRFTLGLLHAGASGYRVHCSLWPTSPSCIIHPMLTLQTLQTSNKPGVQALTWLRRFPLIDVMPNIALPCSLLGTARTLRLQIAVTHTRLTPHEPPWDASTGSHESICAL